MLAEGELLEGQEREVTVMFIDMRDFTPRAASSSARETVALLNEFFDVIVPVVRVHGGPRQQVPRATACWRCSARRSGCPTTPRARVAARGRSSEAVHERFGGEVEVGIGLSSGTVVVGSVGGGGRLEFAVIGDPVNVAARVEAITRETGDAVLLTEATREAARRRREWHGSPR